MLTYQRLLRFLSCIQNIFLNRRGMNHALLPRNSEAEIKAIYILLLQCLCQDVVNISVLQSVSTP